MFELLQDVAAAPSKIGAVVVGQVLLLPHFLPLDFVPEVQATESSDCNAFVGELAVEQSAALFERLSRPPLERDVCGEEGDVVTPQHSQCAFARASLPCSVRSVAADVLNLIVSEAGQPLDSAVGAEVSGIGLGGNGVEA